MENYNTNFFRLQALFFIFLFFYQNNFFGLEVHFNFLSINLRDFIPALLATDGKTLYNMLISQQRNQDFNQLFTESPDRAVPSARQNSSIF